MPCSQMLQMQEWEKSQLTQKAQPDMPDAVDITGDEMVDAEEMDELEEDDNEDDLYAIVDDDFAAYESSEVHDRAVPWRRQGIAADACASTILWGQG